MRTSLVSTTHAPVVEGLEISQLSDALELVSACYEHASHGVLIESSSLPEPFYDLSSRFAGEFVQKLINYQLHVAAVFPQSRTYTERFQEYVHEASNGPQFRSFATREQALEWLSGAASGR